MKKKILFILLFTIKLIAQPDLINREFQVNSYVEYDQQYPAVCGLADGGFIVCWSGYKDNDWGQVSAQIFNADGTKKGNEFLVNTYSTEDQMDPYVARLENGNLVVCW
ncbi:hypothetical protein JW935_05225 [candidate division KSB1 bacterium]|nr:hypothetical protein [candidate division KSB1 bacterium]